jgi:hypothetical protein
MRMVDGDKISKLRGEISRIVEGMVGELVTFPINYILYYHFYSSLSDHEKNLS